MQTQFKREENQKKATFLCGAGERANVTLPSYPKTPTSGQLIVRRVGGIQCTCSKRVDGEGGQGQTNVSVLERGGEKGKNMISDIEAEA